MNPIPAAICWYEGMQLLPQHFQQQALRAEALAAQHAAAAHPWFWGLHQLDIDEAALSGGTLRVQALAAVLPDGLVVNLEAGSAHALTLDLHAALRDATRQTTTVYLAVAPLWRAGRMDTRPGRFRSETGEAVADLVSGEMPESLMVWYPAPKLVTDDSKADFVCLPLLRLSAQGGGFVSQPYVPPTPRLVPESILGRKVAALCARAREKCVFLAARMRLAQQSGHAEDLPELDRQLRSLWARLPEIEAALSSRISHPAQMYLLLAGMAGALATLEPAAGVPAFAPLQYDELLAGFDGLIDWLLAMLDRVRMGYRSVAFGHDDAGFWLTLPQQSGDQARLVIGLRMPGGASENAAAQWLQRCVVAAEAFIPTLARQRMRGLTWQQLDRKSQVSYSVGDDTRLFVLSTLSEWFDATQRLRITPSGSGDSVAPWEIVLFVSEPDSGAE